MLPVILIVLAAAVTLVMLLVAAGVGLVLGTLASLVLAVLSYVGYRAVSDASPRSACAPPAAAQTCGCATAAWTPRRRTPASGTSRAPSATWTLGESIQCRKCGHAEPYITGEALVMAREDCRKRLMFWGCVTAVCALFSLWMLFV